MPDGDGGGASCRGTGPAARGADGVDRGDACGYGRRYVYVYGASGYHCHGVFDGADRRKAGGKDGGFDGARRIDHPGVYDGDDRGMSGSDGAG